MTKKISPIFLLGNNRNGTTWLGNEVGAQKGVASLSHYYHWGIHETSILKKKKYFSNLNNLHKYIEFISLFSKSDLFLLTRLETEFLFKKRFKDFYECFFEVMDEYAGRNNKNYWITKLDPSFAYNEKEYNYFLNSLCSRYQNVKFICIKRNFINANKSYLNMKGASKKRGNKISKYLAVILNAIVYCYSYNFYRKIINKFDGIMISYEDLKIEYEGTVKKIKKYLNLKSWNKVRFIKNSSYLDNKNIVELSNTYVKSIFNLIQYVNNNIPGIAKAIIWIRQRSIKSNRIFYYKILKTQYYKNEYLDVLRKTNKRLYNLIMNENDISNLIS